MKCLIVFTYFILVSLNFCVVVDRQIVIVKSTSNGMASVSIPGSTAVTRYYDNLITYRMKYFLDSESAAAYTNHSGAQSTRILEETTVLYSFNRSNIGTYSSSRFLFNNVTPTETNRFAQYYPILFPGKKVDYAYLAFLNTSGVSCTDLTQPAAYDFLNKQPIVTFQAKFFCSDEEARSEYESIISGLTKSLVALVTMDGLCTSLTAAAAKDTFTNLSAAVTVCELLEGSTNVLCN
jgi:hypothetical protein